MTDRKPYAPPVLTRLSEHCCERCAHWDRDYWGNYPTHQTTHLCRNAEQSGQRYTLPTFGANCLGWDKRARSG